MRKEVIGTATLYLGDCREVWPTLPKHDIIMTDPPYGMSFHSKVSREKGRHDKIAGDDTLDLMDWALNLTEFDKAKYVWARWDNLLTLPEGCVPKSVLTWYKPGGSMGDLDHGYSRETEICMFWPGDNHRWRMKRPTEVVKCPNTNNDLHPTQKPEQLIMAVLEHSAGRTVVDPFMGSGTTGAAALRLGKKFTGIEVNEKYFDICCKRLENTFAKPELF